MLWFLMFLINSVFCANILYISQVASPSHHIWNKALAFGLVNKGHNVTMLSHNNEKETPKNFTLILLEGIFDSGMDDFNMDKIIKENPLTSIKTIYDWSFYCCEYDLKTKGLQILMDYPQDFKFDLIIYDLTLGYCLYPLIERFGNPPTVAVTPYLLPPALSHIFGNPLQTSYMPYFCTTYSDRMDLKERFLNFIFMMSDVLYRKYVVLPGEMKLARKYFGDKITPFEEVERNISLLLTNSDPILMFPLDLPPNIIPLGGLHIKPSKKLPKDLQTLMDENENGVILFTLGSNIKSEKLSLKKRKAILDAFSKVPQTVLWKFETDNLEGLPKNVIIRKWLPQSDILGYHNTRLFISHGGGLGTQEAMYHGVPVMGIPFFGDQHSNMARLVYKKMGVTVDYNNLTEENFYGAMNKILTNPIYRDNIRSLSKKYRDQPQTPLERGIFWVEYVLRYGSAEHLVLAARDMPFYQTANLDVLAIFVTGIIFIYSFILFLITVFKFVYLNLFNWK